MLRFIKHIFIATLQSIPLLLKHIFVNFLPSREKQINSLLWYLLETLINSAAKRSSRHILISRKHFLSLGNKKKSQGLSQVNKVDGLKLSRFQKPKKTEQPHTYEWKALSCKKVDS